MSEGIIVAIITGVLTLAGTIITVIAGMSKTSEAIKIGQAVTDTKIEMLTEEVKKHNNFATEIPVIKEKVENLERRIDSVEKKAG